MKGRMALQFRGYPRSARACGDFLALATNAHGLAVDCERVGAGGTLRKYRTPAPPVDP